MARFVKVTGQSLDARSFYDDVLRLSTKTTLDAVACAADDSADRSRRARSSAPACRSSSALIGTPSIQIAEERGLLTRS